MEQTPTREDGETRLMHACIFIIGLSLVAAWSFVIWYRVCRDGCEDKRRESCGNGSKEARSRSGWKREKTEGMQRQSHIIGEFGFTSFFGPGFTYVRRFFSYYFLFLYLGGARKEQTREVPSFYTHTNRTGIDLPT